MDYKIVSNESSTDTEDQVNTLLNEGWSLHGNLKVTDAAYVQAMVKYKDYEGNNNVSVYLPNIDQNDIEYAIKSIGDALETGLANVAKALASKD